MKTSRTNSFRLHRVSKNTSLRKSSQTFYDAEDTFKLAAINSVSRGVKHADLSFLTGMDLNKLRVEPHESNEGEYNASHHNLTQVRKKYDQMKKVRVGIQEKITKMKQQIEKFNIFKQQYEGKINGAKDRVTDLQNKLKQKKGQYEITMTQKKVLLNMEGRHKADKIYYDQKKFDLDKQYSFLRKQLSIFKKQGIQIDESEDRSVKIYQKLQRQLERERDEREGHIRNLQDMIQQKLVLLDNNQAREADLYQIAERAIQDKDMNEKHWRKIFLTHIFVNKILRNKIDKEMDKFKVVEFAFKEIKTATGVTDAKSLIHKYLNKQAVYGELLGKIADNEKTIEHLKNETEQLIQQCKELTSHLQVLQSIKIKSQDLHQNLKQFEQYDHQAIATQTYQNKLGQWTVRQLKKLSALDKKIQENELPNNLKKLAEIFTNYLKIIDRESAIDPTEQVFKQKVNQLGGKQSERITRVLPKKSRKNSIGEDVFDVEEEETNAVSNDEEVGLINSQRQEVIRNNQKFMQIIKRKREQDRKLNLDKGAAKHDKSPAKPQQIKKEEQ